MEDWDDCVGPAAKSKSVVGKTASSTATVAKAGASKRKLEQSTLPASSDKMPRLPARAAQSEAKSSVPKAKAGQKPCQEGVVAKLPRGQTAVSTSQDKKQRELQIPSPGVLCAHDADTCSGCQRVHRLGNRSSSHGPTPCAISPGLRV